MSREIPLTSRDQIKPGVIIKALDGFTASGHAPFIEDMKKSMRVTDQSRTDYIYVEKLDKSNTQNGLPVWSCDANNFLSHCVIVIEDELIILKPKSRFQLLED